MPDSARPATADANQFLMTSGVYGPNQQIVIELGILTRDADFLNTVSDIFVVPAGSVSAGADLRSLDPSGTPNTVIGTGLGGGIFDEVIGVTIPTGTIGHGWWDIVEDSNQDGIFNGVDSLNANAFRVDIPVNVPLIPDPSLVAMKTHAASLKQHWEDTHAAYAALFQMADAISLYGALTDPIDAVLWVLMENLKRGTGIDPQAIALKMILDTAGHYAGIAADPPDPDYRHLTPLGPRDFAPADSNDVLAVLFAELGANMAAEEDLTAAFLTSLERYQGAGAARDGAWALAHARAVGEYASLLAAQSTTTNSAVAAFAASLSSDARDFDTVAADLTAHFNAATASGFSADQVRELQNRGMSDTEIETLRLSLSGFDFSTFSKSGVLSLMSDIQTANTAFAAAMTTIASDMASIVTTLEADPLVQDLWPTADAGGPYAGAEGVSIPLDGSGSTAVSPATLVTYEWDTDNDGLFDDAVGVAPSATYSAPFAGLVGLRVTDSNGRQDISYAAVTVGSANSPPVFTSTLPAASNIEVIVGTTQDFSATATDPDGDPVTFTWELDGVLAGSGSTGPYTPSASDLGQHLVRVFATDSNPLGGTVVAQWAVNVVHADADSDLWHANIDCDDTDPTVNPAQTEILFNGKDDDCNPATPDSGIPPVASFTTDPVVAGVNEPVQFTDTSTDVDSAIVSWAWDFDGDTVIDSTIQNPQFTYLSNQVASVTLTVTDEHGNTDSVTNPLAVRFPPAPSFTFAPTPQVAKEPVLFTDTSTDPDGSVVAWVWDFGDGATSTDQNPSHIFPSPGIFTVSLTVTDNEGAFRTTSQDLTLLSRPVANYTVPGESYSPLLNQSPSLLDNGATVVGISSTAFGWTGEDLIDLSTQRGWHTASGQNTNQFVQVRLAGGEVHSLTGVWLSPRWGTGDSQSIKNFEIRVSIDGISYSTVFTGVLTNDQVARRFDFPGGPVDAAYVELFAIDNYGDQYLSAGHFEVIAENQGGVLDESSQWRGDMRAALLIDNDTNTVWRSENGAVTNQVLTFRLNGRGDHLIRSIGIHPYSISTEAPRDFRVFTSNDGGLTWTNVFGPAGTRTVLNTNSMQFFDFPAVRSDMVRFEFIDNYGSTTNIRVREVAVRTVGTQGNIISLPGSVLDIASLSSPSRAENGATTPRFTTSAGGHEAVQMLNVAAGTPWAAAVSASPFAVIDLAGDSHMLSGILISPRVDGFTTQSVREFEVWVSNTTDDDAEYVKVLEATAVGGNEVPNDRQIHRYDFPGGPVSARFIKYVPLSNYGDGSWVSTSVFVAIAADAGDLVSVPEIRGGSYVPEYAFDQNVNTAWATSNGVNTDQEFILSMPGGVLNSLIGVAIRPLNTTNVPKDFEIAISTTTDDPASFTTVLTNTLVNTDVTQQFLLNDTVDARYVRIKFLNAHGGSFMGVREISLLQPPASGSMVVDVSSELNSSWVAENGLDFSSSTGWHSANGQNSNQHITVLLPGAKVWTVDRVNLAPRFDSNWSTQSPKNFRVLVSTTTSEDGAFTEVVSGTLRNAPELQEFFFPSTPAKWVKFELIDNYGSSYMSMGALWVFSPEIGAPVALFLDSSTDSDGEIVSYSWVIDGGPATTDRDRDHSFSTPGPHTVELTVTDDDGLSSTITREFFVLSPPVPDFTFGPSAPDEGDNVQFTDQSTDADNRITDWQWNFGDGSVSTSANPAHRFNDDGVYDVTLTVTDLSGMKRSLTKQVTVSNVAPTIDIGPDQAIRRTGETMAVPGGGNFRNFNDPSSIDRTNMEWLWDVGDGRTFTSSTINFDYPAAGVYTITVTITDPQGATATDSMEVTVYDDHVAPTASIGMAGSRNVATPDNLGIASLIGVGGYIHSYSSRWNPSHGPDNLLDLGISALPWASGSGSGLPQWVKIGLKDSQVWTIDRIQIQPRLDCCFEQSVKDFEVWVSSTSPDDPAFTKVLTATTVNNGTVQEFALPGGPVEARFVKLVALSNHGGSSVVSTSSFHVFTADPLGPAGVIDVTSAAPGFGADHMLDGAAATSWRSAAGQVTDQELTLLLENGDVWPVHGISLRPGLGTNEALKDFEVWVSHTTTDPGAFTLAFAGTAAKNSSMQRFWFPAVNAKYVKVIFKNNYGSGAYLEVMDVEIRAATSPDSDGWYNDPVLITLDAQDNAGGSGVDFIEYHTNFGSGAWTRYSGPFLWEQQGSFEVWARAMDVARNQGATVDALLLADPTPFSKRREAGQGGVDWLTVAVKSKSPTLNCVACHTHGDPLFGLSLSSSTGYLVNIDHASGAGWLADWITDPRFQRIADGLWPHPPGGASFVTMNTSHSLFGLAMYDRNVATDKTDNLIRGVNGMLGRQNADGRWALDHFGPPTNQGDIEPTVHMVFALQQAIRRVDSATAATYQASLDRAVDWLKTAGISTYNQDRALKLVGLVESGIPTDDPLVVELRDELLASQLPDGGWKELATRPWSSSFGTGQSVYALCVAGMSRTDPQVQSGLAWLIHHQAPHDPDNLVPTGTIDGSWLLRNTAAGAPFVTTMWPVIALGCFGELNLNFTVAPDFRLITADLATPQTVTFDVTLTNTGAEDDIYDLSASGGLVDWSVSLPPDASLAVGATTTVPLTVTVPANQPTGLVLPITVTATSRKSLAVTRSQTVNVGTSLPPTSGNPTETIITDGDGVDAPLNVATRLAATVNDLDLGAAVKGPGAGVVTFLVAGIAVGSDVDSDGDGVFEINWTPGLSWNRMGQQDLRAIYSGVDRLDPGIDLLPSFDSGLINVVGPVNEPPVADAGSAYSVNEGSTVELDGSGSSDSDGTIVLYEWDLDGDGIFGETGADAAYGDETGATPTFDATLLDGPDSVEVTIRVTDNEAAQHSATATVTVNNVAPTAALANDGPVDEGQLATVSFSGQDDASADDVAAGFIYSYDFGDTGTFDIAGSSDASAVLPAALTADGPASITVRARIEDKDGGFTDYTTVVEVNNVAPTPDAGGPYNVDEGSTVPLSGSATDPAGAADALTFEWDLDGDGVFGETGIDAENGDETGQNPTFDATNLLGPIDVTVVLKVSDGDGGVETAQATVSVADINLNTPPSAVPGGPYEVDEGSTIALDGTGSTDSDGTITLFEWDLDGDGVFGETGIDAAYGDETGATPTFDAALLDGPTSITVWLRVTDDADALNTATTTINVNNVAPSVDAGPDQLTDEGSVVSLAPAAFSDAGTLDTHTATVDWGDATAVDAGTVTELGGVGTVVASHVYADNGLYTVSVCVLDDDGATTCDTLLVTVENVAPVVDAGPDQVVDEGSVVALPPASFSDQGTTDSHTATVDWGDGSALEPGLVTETPFGPPGSTSGMTGTVFTSHVYADNGAYTVSVCVTDDDGATTCDTLLVTVENVAPVVDAGADGSMLLGAPYILSPATFTDVGILDTHTAVIDWGDGESEAGVITESGGSGTVAGTHTYASGGTFTVTVTVLDDDGGAGSATASVTVREPQLDPPIADAGGPYSVDEGATVALDGTNSSDSDGTIVLYEWDLDGDGVFGETGVDAPNGDETGPTPVFSAVGISGPAVITVWLKVTDNDDLSASDSATVNVKSLTPPPPAAVDSLNPPNIPVATGSKIIAAGTGLISQPGSIDFSIPAGAQIQQVLLYWEGQFTTVSDGEILVDGVPVAGTSIGGPTIFFGSTKSQTFRADITSLGLVSTGANSIVITGMAFDGANNGAGVVVIIDDGTQSYIDLRDGNDLAFVNFAPPLDTTVPQVFHFEPTAQARVATLSMFVSSVANTTAGAGAERPSSIEITTGGVTTVLSNVLASIDGDEWDTLTLEVNIPAGADSVRVQLFSRDDKKTGKRPASLTWNMLGLTLPLPLPPQPLALIGHWTFDDGTGTDSSGNGNNGVVSGAAQQPGRIGAGALGFDGVDDYVSAGNIGLPASGVTLAAWINSQDLANCASSDCRIASQAIGTAEQDHYIMLSTINTRNGVKLRFRLKAGGTTQTLIASAGNLTEAAWYHVAATYDGSHMRLFLNGVEVGSAAKSGPIDTAPAVPFWIGGNPDSPTSRPWEGFIDDVRLYNGALGIAEIQALASVAPPPVALIGHWTFDDGTGADSSGNGNNGVVSGAAQQAGRIGAGALGFDGVDDYVSAGNIGLPASGVTLAAWINSQDLANCASSDCRIASQAIGTAEQDHYIMLSTIKTRNGVKLRFRLKAGGTTQTLIASAGNLTEAAWYHVAATYDGSHMRLFLNGVEVGSAAKSGPIDTAPAVPFWIGGNPDSPTSRPWEGLIDDVRLYNGALGIAEIQALASA